MEKVTLEEALEWVCEYSKPERFADIRRHLGPGVDRAGIGGDGDSDAAEAAAAGGASGLACHRNGAVPGRPIYELVEKLDLVLPGSGSAMAPSAVVEARARLGADPLEWLFEKSAAKWAHESARKHAWRGLALYGVDGSTLRVADSPENRAHFGGTSGARGEIGYPLVRITTLIALRSHLLASVAQGPYTDSEIVLSSAVWGKVPDDSLMVVDRGFLAAGILLPLNRDGKNRHWLTRTKSTTRWRVLKQLGKNEDLAEFTISPQARAYDPTLPETFVARVVRYQKKGFKPQTLVTSLTDHKAFPASDLVAVYHERSELELGYNEIKTQMLEREETIRCKSIIAVEQELWGIFLAYNLVRLEMERTADEIGVEPTRISFVGSLRLICEEWWWSAGTRSPGAIPKNLARLRGKIARLALPPRRSERAYPRAVKIKMSNYAKKRSTGAGL